MKPGTLLPILLLALPVAPQPLIAQCHTFTQEHVDLLAFVWNAEDATLRLMASDDTHGGTLYASNQCVVVCPESMKFALPAGTPLGDAGEPLWILPQNPYDNVPYVGVSAERIAAGAFQDPLTLHLRRVEGPGHFLLWQSTSFGSFDVRMDTRDGIGSEDQITPLAGGHEHYNWGFTTSGVYRLYFQGSGMRSGQSTNLTSPETPFTFHVLPLTSLETWTATNWPCECSTNIVAASADPDGDQAPNAFEFGLGSDPKVADLKPWVALSLVNTNGHTHSQLTFTRSKVAPGNSVQVAATDETAHPQWRVLTGVQSVVDQGDREKVTVRDDQPADATSARFYRVQVTLDP